jgi:hypothetical protein
VRLPRGHWLALLLVCFLGLAAGEAYSPASMRKPRPPPPAPGVGGEGGGGGVAAAAGEELTRWLAVGDPEDCVQILVEGCVGTKWESAINGYYDVYEGSECGDTGGRKSYFNPVGGRLLRLQHPVRQLGHRFCVRL